MATQFAYNESISLVNQQGPGCKIVGFIY